MDDRWNTTSVAETHGDAIRASARLLTIVLLALVIGQVIFAAVVIFGLDTWNKPTTGLFLAAMAAGFAVQLFAMAIFVPAFAARNGIKRAAGDVDQLLGTFRVKTILGGAFIEGAGMFNLVAFMIEHNKWSLIPVGLGVLFILSMIPSEMKIANWADGILRTPPAE